MHNILCCQHVLELLSFEVRQTMTCRSFLFTSCFTFCTILFMSEFFSVQTASHFKEDSNYYLNEKGKKLHNPLPLNGKERWNLINFSLWRTGGVCLGRCGSSDAVKMCWCASVSRPQLLTAAFTEILSLMAALCGKETQLWVQAGRTAIPSLTAATGPRFSCCSSTVTGRDRDESRNVWQESFSASAWQSKEGFVAAWGSLGSCAAVTSSLAEL